MRSIAGDRKARSRPAPPSRRRPGCRPCVGVLAISALPPRRPSNRIRSVNVPPTSMPATTASHGLRELSQHRRNPECAELRRSHSLERRFLRRCLDADIRLYTNKLATRQAQPITAFRHAGTSALRLSICQPRDVWKLSHDDCQRRSRRRKPRHGKFPIPAGCPCRDRGFRQALYRSAVLVPHHPAAIVPLPLRRVRDDRPAQRREAGVPRLFDRQPELGRRDRVLLDQGCRTAR